MQSKLLDLAVAMAMVVATPVADAECWINADGTMSCSRSARPAVVQGQPVRNVVRYTAAPVARVVTAPARVVRYGLFGRARYSVQPQATQSSGSTGGYSQSYGSSGGTATYEASSGSSGGTGSYGDGPTDSRATAAPVTKAAPAATVPLSKLPGDIDLSSMSDAELDETLGVCDCGPDCLRNKIKAIAKSHREKACDCGPDCQCSPDCKCKTQLCTVPPAAPTKRLCIVPPTSVSATCRVPASGPSVEAVASL